MAKKILLTLESDDLVQIIESLAYQAAGMSRIDVKSATMKSIHKVIDKIYSQTTDLK